MPLSIARLASITTACLATACAVGPDYLPPEVVVADEWHQELVEGMAEGDAHLHTWWTLLDDPLLEQLIERAYVRNYDLEIAWSRIGEALALRGVAVGNRFPDVNAFGDVFAERFSEGVVPGSSGDVHRTSSLGVDAIWELDVWGRVTRLIESADATLEAQVEGYRDVMVLLFAEVATAYVELRAVQDRIALNETNVKAQEDTLELTQHRFDAELVSQLDVSQARLNLERTRSFLPQLRQLRELTLHRLAVLVGEQPGALNELLETPAPIPPEPDETLISAPADVIRQRPDIRRAERLLAAQSARIGVATAELYPKFSLFGSVSLAAISGSGSDFFSHDSFAWAIGPTMSWNLFDGGRVRGQIEAEKVRTEQALSIYQQTVLLAMEEVENALVGYEQERERRQTLQRSVNAARSSVELVMTLYKTGLVDFQNVLDMQRTLTEQDDQLAQSEGLVIQNLVLLYKAMGGGWDATPEHVARLNTDADGDSQEPTDR